MSSILIPPALGYYVSQSKEPLYEPGWEVPCPFCTELITEDNVRTHSMMQADREPYLSVFFRTHKTCHEEAGALGDQNLGDVVAATLTALVGQKTDEYIPPELPPGENGAKP